MDTPPRMVVLRARGSPQHRGGKPNNTACPPHRDILRRPGRGRVSTQAPPSPKRALGLPTTTRSEKRSRRRLKGNRARPNTKMTAETNNQVLSTKPPRNPRVRDLIIRMLPGIRCKGQPVCKRRLLTKKTNMKALNTMPAAQIPHVRLIRQLCGLWLTEEQMRLPGRAIQPKIMPKSPSNLGIDPDTIRKGSTRRRPIQESRNNHHRVCVLLCCSSGRPRTFADPCSL